MSDEAVTAIEVARAWRGDHPLDDLAVLVHDGRIADDDVHEAASDLMAALDKFAMALEQAEGRELRTHAFKPLDAA